MIDELCRLCGNKNSDMLNIFSEISTEQKLQVKIEEVVRINIIEEDPLPNLICFLCIKHLENACYFINHCHQTQTFLKELCQKSSSLEYLRDGDEFHSNVTNQYQKEKNQSDYGKVKEESSHSGLSDFSLSKENVNSDLSVSNQNVNNNSNDLRKKNIEFSNTSSGSNSNLTNLNFSEKEFDVFKNTCPGIFVESTKHNFDRISKNDNVSTEVDSFSHDKTSVSHPVENETISDRIRLKRHHSSDDSAVIKKSKKTFGTSNFEKNYGCDEIFEIDNECGDSDFESSSSVEKNSTKRIKPLKSSSSRKSCLRARKSQNGVRSSQKSSNETTSNLKEYVSGTRKEIKGKKRLSCDTCKMKFTQELTYQEHLNVHTGNRPFSCKLCEASFRKRQELNQHLRTIHSEKQFKCPLCDHIAKHKGKLTEHMKSVHEKPFACDLCNYRTGEKGKIVQHIANKHTGDLSYVCEICGNGFKTKTSLQTHRQNIHFPEPKVCQTCGTVCPSLARYSAHIFRCGKEKKRFPCDKCGKTYVNKEILKDHMNKHLNIRPYKCDVCGKEFFQRNRLDTHKYVHRGAAYSCEICNQSFNRKDNMKNHMKKHFYKPMRYDNMIVTAV